MTFDDLMSQIGGKLRHFLGISALSIVEFIEIALRISYLV
jgi:hypothetical protein